MGKTFSPLSFSPSLFSVTRNVTGNYSSLNANICFLVLKSKFLLHAHRFAISVSNTYEREKEDPPCFSPITLCYLVGVHAFVCLTECTSGLCSWRTILGHKPCPQECSRISKDEGGWKIEPAGEKDIDWGNCHMREVPITFSYLLLCLHQWRGTSGLYYCPLEFSADHIPLLRGSKMAETD